MPYMERPLLKHAGLFTDYYELTMAQGWVFSGRADEPSVFDYTFRQNPFGGGYTLFAGLADLLEALENLSFDDEDLKALKGMGFKKPFLEFLKSFRFRGTVHSAREGEVVFPLEPVLRVEGGLVECQMVETLLLNVLNFQSLVATKAARVVQAAQGRRVVEFGLRRAQGLAGLSASRAAAVGGAEATSNVAASALWGLTPTGTLGHSWIQSFPDELTAFRAWAELNPDACVLLVDTYDTLASGVPNAVRVARELEAKGSQLLGIRLDSGDLAYLSKKARSLLDAAGLHAVKILVSNQLDEHIVKSLLDQKAPINAFGVGTRLVTAEGSGALDGVYKLCESGGQPRLKVSDNLAKATLPGAKKLVRYADADGAFVADGILLTNEKAVSTIYHPTQTAQKSRVSHLLPENLLYKMMEKGRTLARWTAADAAATARKRLGSLPPEHKRFENPHVYKVGLSRALTDLRRDLMGRVLGDTEE